MESVFVLFWEDSFENVELKDVLLGVFSSLEAARSYWEICEYKKSAFPWRGRIDEWPLIASGAPPERPLSQTELN